MALSKKNTAIVMAGVRELHELEYIASIRRLTDIEAGRLSYIATTIADAIKGATK